LKYLFIALLFINCAPTFLILTNEGKKCFYTCEKEKNQCNASGTADYAMLFCLDADTACKRACDGLEER